METRNKSVQVLASIFCTVMLLFISAVGWAADVGTAFMYQGHLSNGGSPAEGEYDFEFRLFDDPSGPGQVGLTITAEDIAIDAGTFTVPLDFDSGIFTGDARWLEIGVRPGPETGAFTTLNPRQELTPTPYALYALNGPGSSGFWAANGNDIYNGNSGSVGIGTTGPVEKLDVRAGTSPDAPFAAAGQWTIFGSGGIGQHGILGQTADSERWGGVFYNSNSNIEVDIAGPTYGLIVKSGNVGIGTISPIATLQVVRAADSSADFAIAGSNPDGIGVQGSSGDGYGVVGLGGGTGGIGVYGWGMEADTIGVFGAGFNENSYGGYFNGRGFFAGNVGIGVTSPTRRLHVKSSGYTDGMEVTSSDGDQLFRVRESSNGACGVYVSDADGGNTVVIGGDGYTYFNAGNVGIGTTNPQSALDVAGWTRTEVLEITGGSDLAEPFEIDSADAAEPGMVVCIDPENPGELEVSRTSYDRRVAGIISGAGGIKAGMLMGQKGSKADGTTPVALTGRVYCLADASKGPIRPGDLLTTSDIPGHAMKVTDYTKAQGAIIGKAMSSLKQDQGLVLVLVSLQ